MSVLDKTRPDVVLLAVVLPDIRGYEVCRMVRPGEGVNHRWDPDMPSARPDPWRRRLGDEGGGVVVVQTRAYRRGSSGGHGARICDRHAAGRPSLHGKRQYPA